MAGASPPFLQEVMSMTVEEIFQKICTHMLKGVHYHSEMTQAYYFLGLYGYAAEQRHHEMEELDNYNKIIKYYMTHYFKLLQREVSDEQNPIPESWYKYSAHAVDVATKRRAIKDLITKWIEWEKDTKKLYEEMYYELTNLKEVAATIKVQKLIEDVDKELSEAQQHLLQLEAIGYDISLIIDWQNQIKKQVK